jgi:hypothetical protein
MLLLAVLLPLAAATAQPVKNVDAKRWPNLAAAQASIADAYGRLGEAQKANNGDLGGHAERAKQLLIQANNEVKLAATAANAKKGG